MLDQPAADQATAPVRAAPARHDWGVDEIVRVHDQPLLDLIAEANRVHRAHHDPSDVQRASLLSIKTGGCPEDCAYCPQSAHHREVKLDRVDLMQPAAVLTMVEGVRALGMEACVTLGMLTAAQAGRLKEAGLTAYNHNLDTGPDFYDQIISTRGYDDRLATLRAVRGAGIEMCCGGIIGMGEGVRDRAAMLQVLAGFDPHPESVPINALVPVAGTPLAAQAKVEPLDLVRMIATTRIVMPLARVRLSAGRSALSMEAQVLCMTAGANSIFYGETLLTTANDELCADEAQFEKLAARESRLGA